MLLCQLLNLLDLLQGKTSQIKPKLQHDLLPAVIANWKLWIPFQFINFRLVPPPLQVSNTSPVMSQAGFTV